MIVMVVMMKNQMQNKKIARRNFIEYWKNLLLTSASSQDSTLSWNYLVVHKISLVILPSWISLLSLVFSRLSKSPQIVPFHGPYLYGKGFETFRSQVELKLARIDSILN